jgi:hypothetical protein
MNSFYGNFFPDTFIHYEYKSEIIEKLLFRQEKIIEKMKEKKRQGKNLDPRSYILMDDCLASKGTWMRDQPITTLLFNGRHYEIMYILTMQFPLGITPELRCNFDYIFLLAEDTHSNLKRIYDHYAGMFPTFDSFRQVFTVLTGDFGSMVIDNRRKATNPLERLFWYKAGDLSKTQCMMGGKQFQKYHNCNYDKDWRKKTSNYDFVAWTNDVKKNKGIIQVEKEEVDEDGNVIDKKKQSTMNFNKSHNRQNNYGNNNSTTYKF